MKKSLVFFTIILFFLKAAAFANDNGSITIGIQGFGNREDQVTFFRDAFMTEAAAVGYKVTDRFDYKYADYGIRFDIAPNTMVSESQFIIRISLTRIRDLSTLVTASYLFTDLEEMVPYTQFLFFRLMANVPGYRSRIDEDSAWKNKRLYARASFDYPIIIYDLKGDGLISDSGAYVGDYDEPLESMPLDNRINALPGATLGVEAQLLNWLSVEANIKAYLEEFYGDYSVFAAAGVELKFPVKIRNFMIEPYGVFSYPLIASDRFAEFPRYYFGGGVQFAVKGGKNGAFFVDVNFLYSFDEAVMTNPFGELYPEPPVIKYNRSVIGIGIGYKYGFFDRTRQGVGE